MRNSNDMRSPNGQATVYHLQQQIATLQTQLEKSLGREDRLITEIQEKDLVRDELEAELNAQHSSTRGRGAVPMLHALAETPPIPSAVFDGLPDFLRFALELFDDVRERDVFLTGALALLSGCLPNVWGRYHTGLYAPNLYAFIIAPAGSGKSALTWARRLVRGVHDQLKQRSAEEIERWEYRQEQYKQSKRNNAGIEEAPGERPPKQWLLIPGDVSSAAFVRALAASNDRLILFETEADTLSQTLEKEWGAFSDILRKAHAHEPIASLRRDSSREVERPCLSVALSGTPAQLPRLIPSIENGLWSRFCFYGFLPDDPVAWHDVKPQTYTTKPEEVYRNLAKYVLELYNALEGRKEPLSFTLQDHHWDELNQACAVFKRQLFMHFGYDSAGTANRVGLHIFRLAMSLTMWRVKEAGTDINACTLLKADDTSFNTALTLGMLYATHAEVLMSALPHSGDNGGGSERKILFYEALPDDFQTSEAVAIASSQGLPDRTAKRYLQHWRRDRLLRHVEKGRYQKPST